MTIGRLTIVVEVASLVQEKIYPSRDCFRSCVPHFKVKRKGRKED